ncbi:MAG: tetratricopeptide repeat protein [Lentisphaeria bacterium]|nr:tetratricopeptide repeat protein [Lentisphaeria bacterium]
MRNLFQTDRRASGPAESLPGVHAGRILLACTVAAPLLLSSGVSAVLAQDAGGSAPAVKQETVKAGVKADARQKTEAGQDAGATTAPRKETAKANTRADARAKTEAKTETGSTPQQEAVKSSTKADAKTDARTKQDVQPEEPSYPDKESGDRARAEAEYGTAASFYRQYRAKAEQNGDAEARKDAYGRELDALILANLADSAQKLLDEYRAAFPLLTANSVKLWQAEIYLLQRRADDADKLLGELIPTLEKLDPGYYRALSCAAFVAELKGDYAAAAKHYGDIAANAGVKTTFGRRAAERQALALAALGKHADAYAVLNSLPVADSKRDVDALKLLSFYLTLSEKGADAIAEDWSGIRSISVPRKDNFFFLAACRIGEEFTRLGDHVRAAEAFHLAYSLASVREDAFDAMTHLIGSFQRLEDRKTAADLAVRMLPLFKDARLSPDFKLQIASVLFQAKRTGEAMEICLTCVPDETVPDAERETVYRRVLDTMIAEKAFESARKFVEAYDTVPAKKNARAMDLAEVTWREGKPAEAAKLYRTVGETAAESRPRAMLNAMRCLLEAGLFADLLDVAAQLRETEGKNLDPNVIYLSAIAQEKTGDSAAAAQSYLDYEKAAPKTPETLERRGSALYAAGRLLIRLSEPAKALDSLLRLRQNYSTLAVSEPGRYWLIHALYASGDNRGAENESRHFIEDAPDSEYAAAARLRLAEHYREIGSVQYAENTIEQLLNQEKYPKIRARASYEKALIAYQRDDLAAALTALETIDALSPDASLLADVHYLRGDIFRASGDFTTARMEYEAAAKAVPGTLLEQAALGSAADCIYALATGSASATEVIKPKENAPAASQTAGKPAPASQSQNGTKPSATAQPAGTNKPASATAQPADAEPAVVFPSAEACRLAADAYQALLKIDGLRPEYRAMAIYKSGQSLWKAGDEKKAFDLFNQMIYLVPARDAASRPVEAFWIFRAVDALESLAHKDPADSNVESAVSALIWLGQTGTVDQSSIRQRIRALRKKKYQPPLPAPSNTITSPESSKS